MGERDDEIGSAATQVGTTQPTSTGAGRADPPQVLADRYEILGLLGAGGMGRVYRAHDRVLDELVALKMLRHELVGDAGMLEAFRQEVKLARRVTNEHVVRTFDLGQHGDEHFLTMELIDGRSLARQLEEDALPLGEALAIARKVSAGMAAAHAAGVLHRDLKPDNILVARTGRIAITDFGIARIASDPTATQDRFAGTPAYMAPEQVEGAPTIGPAADVYALGAIMFEMVTRRRPFVGTDPIAVALARLREPTPDPRLYRTIPDALAAIIVRCLARDPGARFADAGELGRALADVVARAATATPPTPVAIVPTRSAPTVAILPLRAPADLVELAEGLSEEIVDALSMTRSLRVRPLTSLRAATQADRDSLTIGRSLGVDVVVDGSIRRRGSEVRITARAIGVADGFQLWANHVDTASEGLLAAGDEIARAIARALTVEIQVPVRAAGSARATEIYLENKARIRAQWIDGQFERSCTELEHALQLAPDDAAIQATLAMALARAAFYGADTLTRARVLADRAVAAAPHSGEAWLALAFACHYDGAVPEAARAFHRALVCAPGLAMAHAALGGILLEAGDLESAVVHLESAQSIDPSGMSAADLARAYAYAERWAEAEQQLARMDQARLFGRVWTARFRAWRGERDDVEAMPTDDLQRNIARFGEIASRVFRTRTFDDADREELIATARTHNVRLRASRFQFIAEFAMVAGLPDRAMEAIAESVASALQDHQWIEHCPLLAPLRDRPRFGELAAIVAQRAHTVRKAVASSEADAGRA